jgi:hypothetical protein
MRPGASEVLNGVKQIILNILQPELQTEQARLQAMYATLLLEHVAARWDIEGPLLLEERAELRALMTQALSLLGGAGGLAPRLHEALEPGQTTAAGPRALDAENERMRRLVPALAREVWDAKDERLLELDAAVRAYTRNQHRRDQKIVEVGEVAW